MHWPLSRSSSFGVTLRHSGEIGLQTTPALSSLPAEFQDFSCPDITKKAWVSLGAPGDHAQSLQSLLRRMGAVLYTTLQWLVASCIRSDIGPCRKSHARKRPLRKPPFQGRSMSDTQSSSRADKFCRRGTCNCTFYCRSRPKLRAMFCTSAQTTSSTTAAKLTSSRKALTSETSAREKCVLFAYRFVHSCLHPIM